MLNKSCRYAGESPLIILSINVALSFFLRVERLVWNMLFLFPLGHYGKARNITLFMLLARYLKLKGAHNH